MTDFSLKKIALPAFGPTLLFGIGEGAVIPLIPLLARDLGASIATAALLMTLISIGSLLNNVPASLLTARWGERWAMLGAGLWSALAMGLCILSSALPWFALGCLMLGMSQSVYNLARLSFLAEVVPPSHRARALSTLGGVLRIGVFIGPLVTAWVVHRFSLGAAFAVGIVSVLGAAALGMAIPELSSRQAPQPPGAARVTLRSTFIHHRRVYLTLGIAILLVSAVRASRQAVLPLWADHIGLEAAAAALIYGLAGGMELLVFYPAGKVMDTKGRRWVAVPAMLTMGFALLCMPLTTGFNTLLIAALAVGLGNGIGSGMNMTIGADHAPREGRAYFLGVWRLMSDMGSTCGPALISLFAAALSLATGIAVAGAMSLLAAGLLFRWLGPAPDRSARPPGP